MFQPTFVANMNPRLLSFLVAIGIYLFLTIISYMRLRSWYKDTSYWRKIQFGVLISELLVIAGLIAVFYRLYNPPVFPSAMQNWLMGASFSMMIGKIIFGLIVLVDGLIGLPFLGVNLLQKKEITYHPTRRKFVKNAGLVIAGIPFISMINGITFGKYAYQVRRVTLKFHNLPKSFHGFTIAQLSDIHSGSFDNIEEVKKGVAMVNELQPDLIAFTGDLVNGKTTEVLPFIDVFKELKAKYGVYSTKGNHDYGIYRQWSTEEDRINDQLLMDDVHQQMGFKLLKNEHAFIEKNNEKIQLVGVENWGKPPFPQVGDLDKSIGNTDADFKVLLSHDPSHWDEKVRPHKKQFDLTLSGHTHGMQFGVEIPGFIKWSPVKYRYPRWAGLYQEGNEYLYVNRGFGFIGFPGRVGIMPEITLITLETA